MNRPSTPFNYKEMELLEPECENSEMIGSNVRMISNVEDEYDLNAAGAAECSIDIEEALQNLESLDNLTQLYVLKQEINHIMIHNIPLSESWYDDRFRNIQTYSQLNWCELMYKFHNKDKYIHDTAQLIMRLCDELLEECSIKPNFHLPTYYKLIHDISDIWTYYHSKYMGEEDDADVIDLIEGLTYLMK